MSPAPLTKDKIEACDFCGWELTKRQDEIYEEISNDSEGCYCGIVVRIAKLEKKDDRWRKRIKEVRDSLIKELQWSKWTRPEIRQMIKEMINEQLLEKEAVK